MGVIVVIVVVMVVVVMVVVMAVIVAVLWAMVLFVGIVAVVMVEVVAVVVVVMYAIPVHAHVGAVCHLGYPQRQAPPMPISLNTGIDVDMGMPLSPSLFPLLTMSKSSVTSGCMLSSDLTRSGANLNSFPSSSRSRLSLSACTLARSF